MPASIADMPQVQFTEHDTTTGALPELLARAAQQHGPILRRATGRDFVFMIGPEANRFVLHTHRQHFSHDEGWTPIIGEDLGKGLLNMDDPLHAVHRKLWNPAFTQAYMAAYVPIMQRVIAERTATWPERDEIDVFEEAREITFDIAAGALAGFQGAKVDRLRELFYTLLHGWAFRYKMLDDGRRQILNFALPADMVGLQGALMREMEHSVEALTPLTLCVFPRSKLWDLYSRFPSLAFDITWLAAREEQSVMQLMDTVIHQVEYQDFVNDGTEDGMERWGNVLELRAVAGDTLPDGPPAFSLATTALGLRAPDVAVTRDLPFTVRGATLRLDRYDPPGSGALRPAVVVVHGGSWRGGDKGQSLTSTTEWSQTLAGHGFVVYDIQYRLVPDVRHPVPFEDVRCALAHVRASSAADGVDPERVVLLGRSAGAHLALLAAYRDDAPCGSAARVRGVVALYGPTDLLAAYAFPGDPDLIGGRELLRGLVGGTPDDAGDRFRDAMPRTWLAGAVPTLLIHGSADQLVYPRHSEDLAQRLRERGAPVALVRLPWSGHSFDAVSVGVGGQVALSATVRFARAVTRPG